MVTKPSAHRLRTVSWTVRPRRVALRTLLLSRAGALPEEYPMHPVLATFTTFTWLLVATAPLVAAAPDLVRLGDATWHRSEWRASTCAKSTQAQATLALDSEDNVLVVWSSRRQQGGRYGVYAQRFAANGAPAGLPYPAPRRHGEWPSRGPFASPDSRHTLPQGAPTDFPPPTPH